MRLKLRRGTTAEWSAKNPILAAGEPGFEKDTSLLKVGDGHSRWSDLDYVASGSDGSSDVSLNDHIQSETPHPAYDDGPSLVLLYENAKV